MFEKPESRRGMPEKRGPLTGTEYRKGNLPGTDTYDDGLDEKGRLIAPGSTSTESGGTYMEDKGPMDMRRRASDHGEHEVIDPEVTISDSPDQPFDDEDDEAAKWLKANDPTYKNKK